MSKIIDTRTNIEEVGDAVPEIDAWMSGDIDYDDLSDEGKKTADAYISKYTTPA
jgi:hypothetical protein